MNLEKKLAFILIVLSLVMSGSLSHASISTKLPEITQSKLHIQPDKDLHTDSRQEFEAYLSKGDGDAVFIFNFKNGTRAKLDLSGKSNEIIIDFSVHVGKKAILSGYTEETTENICSYLIIEFDDITYQISRCDDK